MESHHRCNFPSVDVFARNHDPVAGCTFHAHPTNELRLRRQSCRARWLFPTQAYSNRGTAAGCYQRRNAKIRTNWLSANGLADVQQLKSVPR